MRTAAQVLNPRLVFDEARVLIENQDFLQRTLGLRSIVVHMTTDDEAQQPDIAEKVGAAEPGRPAVNLTTKAEIHPFNFLRGVYNEQEYQAEVKSVVPRIANDQDLQGKVAAVAGHLFSKLKVSSSKVQIESAHIEHKGLVYRVNCACQAQT